MEQFKEGDKVVIRFIDWTDEADGIRPNTPALVMSHHGRMTMIYIPGHGSRLMHTVQLRAA